MADRATKRARRLSTDYEDSEGADDWPSARAGHHLSSAAPTASSTRPRRGTTNQPPPAAVIQRSSPEETRQSIHLTVKASPGKLRKATSGNAKTAVSSRNIVRGKRASRSSRVIREVDSDDDDDEEDDDDEDDEPDAMDVDDDDDDEEDVDAEGDEDDDVDAEGDEDEDMDEVTPAPRVVSNPKSMPAKPNINVTKPQDSVEAKEMAMDDDDDEELSELDSEVEDEDAEGEDEDAEGEEDEEMGGQNLDDEDEDMDSDDDMSRDQTPDLSKMTRRQRAMALEDREGDLLALSNEAQKKKHLTAEEHAMRRAEMARRRKNLSEKRNEEEKMDTINRLLKKQPPKRGRRVVEVNESGQEDEPEVEKANPLYVRYTQTVSGTQMAIPEEWLESPTGSVFTGPLAKPSGKPFGGRMVEEVA